MKKILVIDNFDSFTFNLVDYFKRLECEVLVLRNNVSLERIDEFEPDLIVLSPGPSVPRKAGKLMEIIDKFHQKYPIFGVCLGMEALVEYFGGTLKFVEPVHGKSSAISHNGKGIFEGLEKDFMAGRYHSLAADRVPDCFEITARAGDLVMGIVHKELPIVAVQFHPESVLTLKHESGFNIINNIVHGNIGIS
jgi:anthranilate synthase/aminodeoxychorismate synthase-like glutamine amidotransferase